MQRLFLSGPPSAHVSTSYSPSCRRGTGAGRGDGYDRRGAAGLVRRWSAYRGMWPGGALWCTPCSAPGKLVPPSDERGRRAQQLEGMTSAEPCRPSATTTRPGPRPPRPEHGASHAARPVAVSAAHVSRTYGAGHGGAGSEGREPGDPRRHVRGSDGALGLRQVHPRALPRRARLPDRNPRPGSWWVARTSPGSPTTS
ncbi:hypothetical protein QJS66_12705 [Kocuria rhizophila]|nr:hypothetical protein QJS66_12705 [Kocuria rhizophila]